MKRLLPFVFLILLVVGGIIAVPVLLNPERHRKEITATVSKVFKRPAVIGPMSLSYFPPTLQVGQVAIRNDAGTPVLQIESLSAPLDMGALFHLKFAPEELQLNHWTLTILRKPDGRWDLEDWFGGASAPTLQGISLRQVGWKEGQIHWVDSYGSLSQELILGSLSGHWDPKAETLTTTGAFSGLSSTAQLTFNAKGKFFSSPQGTGDLQLSDGSNQAAFHIDFKPGTFELKGGSARWGLANALAFLKFYGRGAANSADSLNSLVLENWQLHITASAGSLVFEHTSGISGGIIEAKGTVDSQPGGLHILTEGAAKDIPADAIWNLMGQNIPLTGKVTAVAKDVDLVLSMHTVSSLKGQGYWELKDGLYQVPASSVQKLAKAKTMAYMKKKVPDFETKGFPVGRLAAHWTAKNGIVVVEDGLFTSTDMKAGWTGHFDAFRQGLDGYLRLDLHEKNPQNLRLIPTQYMHQPVFGHFQGTWQEWTLRSVRQGKIPTPVQSKLRKAVNQK